MIFWAVLPDGNPNLVVAFFKDEEAAINWRNANSGGAAVRKATIMEFLLWVILA